MKTIEEINNELERIGGEREVLKVKRVEENHVIFGPPYFEKAIPKSSIDGDISKLKKGDRIIVNMLAERAGIGLKTKYYYPSLKEVF